jgi:hypothetical protein
VLNHRTILELLCAASFMKCLIFRPISFVLEEFLDDRYELPPRVSCCCRKQPILAFCSGPHLFYAIWARTVLLHDRLNPSSGAGCSSYGFQHHITLLPSQLPGVNLPVGSLPLPMGPPPDPPSHLCELGPVIE